MKKKNLDYVDVIYNEKDRPLTTYPAQLTAYLSKKYGIQKGIKLLDLGCGRGEFLAGFINCGVKGYGVDQSNASAKLCPSAELRVADLEIEKTAMNFQDTRNYRVSSEKAQKTFNFRPVCSIDDGIEEIKELLRRK